MTDIFLVELYNLHPNEMMPILECANSNGEIDDKSYSFAKSYLEIKLLMIESKNEDCVKSALKAVKFCNNLKIKGLFYKLIGDALFFMSDYLNANQNYINAIAALEEEGGSFLLGPLYYSLSFIALLFEQFDRSLFYLDKAVKYNPEEDLVAYQIYPYTRLYLKGRLSNSKKYLDQMEELLEQNYAELERIPLSFIHMFISVLSEHFELYENVIRHSEAALEYKKDSVIFNYNHNMVFLMKNIINANIRLGRYEKALSLCKIAKSIDLDRKRYAVYHSIHLLEIESLLKLDRDEEAFLVLKNSLLSNDDISVLDPFYHNLGQILDSFINKILAKKEFIENMDLLEKTKIELRKFRERKNLLNEQDKKLSHIKEIVKMMYIEESKKQLYETIKNNLDSVIPYSAFVIGILDDKKEVFAIDLMVGQNRSINEITLPAKLFPKILSIMKEGKTVIQTETDDNFITEMSNLGTEAFDIKSYLIAPLKNDFNDEILGFCMVQSDFKNTYNRVDTSIFETLSCVISSKLFQINENKDLEDDLQNVKKMKLMLQSYNDKLDRYELLDPITGIYNKNGLYSEVLNNFNKMSDAKLNLGFIDVVSFRTLNERYCCQVADNYLITLKDLIVNNFELKNSVFCRYDDDKFLVLSYKMKSKLVYEYLERVLAAIVKNCNEIGYDMKIDIRFGYSSLKVREFLGGNVDHMDTLINESFCRLKKSERVNKIAFLNLKHFIHCADKE